MPKNVSPRPTSPSSVWICSHNKLGYVGVCSVSTRVIFTVATLALLTSARMSVSTVFFLHGAAGGMWIARIPAVQETLVLSVGELGLALLGGGLGSLLALLPGGALVARYGSRQVALWAPLPACAALALLALATNGSILFAALVLWGASAGVLDVAMNAQGSAIEQRRARPIMSSLHGLWSLGTMSGAAVAALVAGLGISVRAHLLVAAPILLGAMLVAARPFVSGDGGQSVRTALSWPRGQLLTLAVVAFCAVGTEGAMYDWSGVYLRRVLDAPQVTAASAATFLSAAMATGRLVGDHLTVRLQAPVLARVCAAGCARCQCDHRCTAAGRGVWRPDRRWAGTFCPGAPRLWRRRTDDGH